MAAGFFSLAKSESSAIWGVAFDKTLLGVAGGLVAVAGACGGIVGSSTFHFRGLQAFMKAPIGPWNCQWLTGAEFAHWEHTLFWLGLAFSLASLVVGKRSKEGSLPSQG